MSTDILGAVRKIMDLPKGLVLVLSDFAEKLLSNDGSEWLAEFKKFLRKENCWTGVSELLEFIGNIVIPKHSGEFVARKTFVIGNSAIKFYGFGDNFSSKFLGKIEGPAEEMSISYYKLKKSSVDSLIIAERGGDKKVESTLFALACLLENQGKGEKGALLTNGYANIFYIRDVDGKLWAVFVYWDVDGWFVGANSLENPSEWSDGLQVFSGNSVS